MTAIPLTMSRGSDFKRKITYGAEVGAMNGWTFDIVDVSPASMAGKITCRLTSAANRTAMVEADWGDWWPPGRPVCLVTFYIKASGLDAALGPIRIDIE